MASYVATAEVDSHSGKRRCSDHKDGLVLVRLREVVGMSVVFRGIEHRGGDLVAG
jgi:hypothetical protein